MRPRPGSAFFNIVPNFLVEGLGHEKRAMSGVFFFFRWIAASLVYTISAQPNYLFSWLKRFARKKNDLLAPQLFEPLLPYYDDTSEFELPVYTAPKNGGPFQAG